MRMEVVAGVFQVYGRTILSWARAFRSVGTLQKCTFVFHSRCERKYRGASSSVTQLSTGPEAFEDKGFASAPWHCQNVDPPPWQCIESHIIGYEVVFGTEEHPYRSSPILLPWLGTVQGPFFVPQNQNSPKRIPFWYCWKRPVSRDEGSEQSLIWRLPALLRRMAASLESCSVSGGLLWRWSSLIVCFLNKRIFLEIILIIFRTHLICVFKYMYS